MTLYLVKYEGWRWYTEKRRNKNYTTMIARAKVFKDYQEALKVSRETHGEVIPMNTNKYQKIVREK